jgi:hypothetical protein
MPHTNGAQGERRTVAQPNAQPADANRVSNQAHDRIAMPGRIRDSGWEYQLKNHEEWLRVAPVQSTAPKKQRKSSVCELPVKFSRDARWAVNAPTTPGTMSLRMVVGTGGGDLE